MSFDTRSLLMSSTWSDISSSSARDQEAGMRARTGRDLGELELANRLHARVRRGDALSRYRVAPYRASVCLVGFPDDAILGVAVDVEAETKSALVIKPAAVLSDFVDDGEVRVVLRLYVLVAALAGDVAVLVLGTVLGTVLVVVLLRR